MTASFLAGAKGRLLPPSIPFRFFAVAVACHVLLWIPLLLHPDDMVGYRGGPGPALAAIHLLTLGVLTTTAIGASVQLLPVATRRALAATWPIVCVFWLALPGLTLLIGGMSAVHVPFIIAGAVLIGAALLLYAVLLAHNLLRASTLGVVAAYGWAALAALLGLVGLGTILALDYRWAIASDHGALALAHLILGGYGFMGMLALGFSHILVPMLALGTAPPKRAALPGCAAACTAIALAVAGTLAASPPLLTTAAVIGLGAAAWHVRLMQRVRAGGMRKRLGLSFVLVRASWWILLATFPIGLAALHGHAGPNGPTLFGLLVLAGWLLTFLLGILQRILPFLASMHAASGGVLMSELAAARPLRLHALCHGAALALMAAAMVLDLAPLLRLGAAAGLAGAIAFAWFSADVMRKVRRR